MSKFYKIHPAIGIARLGNHETAFFIGPEKPGAAGLEISADGSESPLTRYKGDGNIKRQAARFRVYEYEKDGSGAQKLVGEVNGDQVRIEWQVDLVNRKAALDHSPAPGHPAGPRNVNPPYGSVERDKLIIRDKRGRTVVGKNQSGIEFVGKFLGKDVYLGELRTDRVGRLFVLGGRGNSEGIPLNPGDPIPSLDDFANNDGWHDDVADGPVTATLTFAGQTPIQVHQPAWVVVAPPDYAPGIDGLVTLYDVATEAAIDGGMLKPELKPSFYRHIKPVIEHAAGLRWVHNWSRWSPLLPLDWKALSDPGPGSADLRKMVGNRIKSPGLRDYVIPNFLKTYLDQWVAGNFDPGLNNPVSALSEPALLDRAALDACIGANFYPGIEASITLRDKDIYGEPYRLNHAVTAKVYPGCFSEIMALPWQADFMECNSGTWWPSQRPDIAMLDKTNIPGSQQQWAAPLAITDHQGMVDHWKDFGFIVADQAAGRTVFVEVDRDPGFPR